MESAPKNNEKDVSDNEVKESAPKIDTVYAYMQTGRNGVMALYTNKEELMNVARLDNMFATEEETFVPLHVYEKEEELPEEIRKRIISYDEKRNLPMPALTKEEGVVYAILPNTDSTEGNGHRFIWTLVTDPLLANKIAIGNGPSGSNAEVAGIHLNKFPLDLGTSVILRRGARGELTDELYA